MRAFVFPDLVKVRRLPARRPSFRLPEVENRRAVPALRGHALRATTARRLFRQLQTFQLKQIALPAPYKVDRRTHVTARSRAGTARWLFSPAPFHPTMLPGRPHR